ncbi:MAG TPA: carboxypeptidase-like regulatory domain-containing protein, partial [Candidatus Eisenbacteria bacterium]|nr:carboxypeptidase-like regulatory domain-containing protein [Candidatus Eisenbacteria bacterium]
MNIRKLSKFGFAILALGTCMANAQTELAHVSGRVTDQAGAVVVDTEVEIRSVDTNLSTTIKTNQDGFYTFPSLRPGRYQISARKPGFKTFTVTQFSLNAQDNVSRDFVLQVGSTSENVTVTAETLNINTTDATVSTVVDRQFADNLPLNGRSFQSLIELTPGVLPTGGEGNTDTFVVNGQRETSNYWTVDGVSANFGIGGNIGNPGAGLGGQASATSLSGGTNSLVSVDALEEFRIQTSTAAPDSGLTAGGQIAIVTRSGTNQFHGSLFDYFRNDVLDANDWFNGYTNTTPLPKAEERQNDFGGTFGGPILKDRTFFFFSYEGLRLRLPQTELTQVPDL